MPKGQIPSAFRFKPGMLPPDGRLTTPTGTFFDSPSTASDGVFGAGGGALNTSQFSFSDFAPSGNIPNFTPQVPGYGQLAGVPAQFQSIARQTLDRRYDNLYFDKNGTPLQTGAGLLNPIAYDSRGNRYEWNTNTNKYERPTTGAFTPPSPSVPTVGQDLGSSPQTVTIDMLRSIFPGRTQGQLNEIMMSMGYTPHMVNGNIASYLRTQDANKPAGSPGGQTLQGAKPAWLSASEAGALAPGETVDTENAVFRGGTPTTKDVGTTPAGTSQYSVTLKQNIDKKLDAEGEYRWKKITKRDANGNWVAVYVKELRKVNSRFAQRQRAEEEQRRQASSTTDEQAQNNTGADFSQLITLRVNYG